MSADNVNLQKKLSYTLKWCSWSRQMRNQEAGNTLGFFASHDAGFTARTRWEKKHTLYIKILLWLKAHMLNPKLFCSWKKRGSRKIKTKTPPQTYSNLHNHTLSHMDALTPIYPSKPPSTHLNPIVITTTSTYAPTLTYILTFSLIYTYVTHGLLVCRYALSMIQWYYNS